jgi:hypothetical protein
MTSEDFNLSKNRLSVFPLVMKNLGQPENEGKNKLGSTKISEVPTTKCELQLPSNEVRNAEKASFVVSRTGENHLRRRCLMCNS